MENNRKLSASCIVMKDNKVLLVKHTYGVAKGKYLIPGGFSSVLKKSEFVNARFDSSTWQLFI